jgi:hypothetical protein
VTLGSKDDYPKAGIYLGIILRVSPCSSTLPPRYQCHSAGGVLLKFLTATHLMQRLICVPGLCLCFGYCANVLLAAHGARFGGHSKPGGPGINMLIQSLSKHFKQSIPPKYEHFAKSFKKSLSEIE